MRRDRSFSFFIWLLGPKLADLLSIFSKSGSANGSARSLKKPNGTVNFLKVRLSNDNQYGYAQVAIEKSSSVGLPFFYFDLLKLAIAGL